MANIIKDLAINETTGQPVMNEAISSLKQHVEGTSVLDDGQLEQQLGVLTSELYKSVPHRVQAAKSNTQEYLNKLIEAEIEKGEGDHESSVNFAISEQATAF